MNICIIAAAFLPEIIGTTVQTYNVCRQFSKTGNKVLVLCPDYSIEKEIFPAYEKYIGKIYDNVTIKPVPSQRNKLRADKIKYQEHTLWNFDDYINGFNPDIIHVDDPDRIYGLVLFGMDDSPTYNDAIGVKYARKHKIPIVAYYQTNYPEMSKEVSPKHVVSPYMRDKNEVYRMVYGDYDTVLCSGRSAAKQLRDHGINNVRHGWFMGVNEELFDCGLMYDEIDKTDIPKIFYAGRLDGGKDVSVLLDIFEEVGRQQKDIELYVAGFGDSRSTQRIIAACELDKRIKYLGQLSQQDLVRAYNSVDIYFSPYGSDTFGLSIVEAMYKGLPVVAANEGGPVDFVKWGFNGYLCDNKKDYVESLLCLCKDKLLRDSFGKESRRIAKEYSITNCARNLIETYKNIIDSYISRT